MSEVINTDHLIPLNGIAGFDSKRSAYEHTLFHFPLRSTGSKLSENIYTIEKVNELIDALKSEANLLLLFLRSITTIEVYSIDEGGNQTLSFQTKIADAFVSELSQKRRSLLADLKRIHNSHQYNFPDVLKFTARFDVCVYNINTGLTTTSHWLVANQIGSSDSSVRKASVKQMVFPWAGTALELGNTSANNGRIFCFLPMPIEAASNLPIHVNGTFGLTDDRRSLKWPGVDRKNDPTANWNELLVKEVIPSCYVDLLLEAKNHLSMHDNNIFYKAWPDVNRIRGSHWEDLLSPVYDSLLMNSVLWSAPLRQSGEWVTPSVAVFIPESQKLKSIVERSLVNCDVKLVDVPTNVWSALKLANISVTRVAPAFTRNKLRACPSSYNSIDPIGKRELLKYCLSDGVYHDIVGLALLPLSNSTFVTYEGQLSHSSNVYLCTPECPRYLLPNLDEMLVDVSEDSELQCLLSSVAQCKCTQLKQLNVMDVASLMDKLVPTAWLKSNKVSFPNSSGISLEWFEKFWKWVQDKNIKIFASKLILPTLSSDQQSSTQFDVIRLNELKNVIFIPQQCDRSFLPMLYKFKILCCVQKDFPYVKHNSLNAYLKFLEPNGLIDALSHSPGHSDVILSSSEAESLRKFLQDLNFLPKVKEVLNDLCIFIASPNSPLNQLYSVKSLCQHSRLQEPVVVDTSSNIFNFSLLPSDILVFSSTDYYQKQLLSKLQIHTINESSFFIYHIFSLIRNRSIQDDYIDSIMLEVLSRMQLFASKENTFMKEIQSLPFIKIRSGMRKRPEDLFDPKSSEMSAILAGEDVFPCEPYNTDKSLVVLRSCGLRSSITPQEVLDTIHSISLPSSSNPQKVDRQKFTRAQALLKHVGRKEFERSAKGSYKLGSLHYGYLPFTTALDFLSSNRCWLPILCDRPSEYPSVLPWKGKGFSSHLCTLNETLSIATVSKPSNSLLYGSQLFFIDSVLQSDVLTSKESPSNLIAHFEQVILLKNSIEPNQMLDVLHKIYSAMLAILRKGSKSDLNTLQSLKEWVYIKECNRFVSPDIVALEWNPTFRHNLEPYVYKLPDSISNYSDLFVAFGVNKVVSHEQIVSIMDTIKTEITNSKVSVSVKESWSLIMAILNWLTENGTKSLPECDKIVYVPVESESEWPDLRATSEVIYTDNEFLKRFTIASETDKTLLFIHKCISLKMAECLSLTPLSRELDISDDAFEDTGQYEPLTTRLRNILRDYKDGITIIKELIQNADDAEATEVNICFDARNHTKDEDKLFFPGMSESHGPALVVHNNQTFSEEDFENITKLAGATKQRKRLKIGKFGIGFCSVYHVTDVPSFISRDRVYIFDPTLKHLGNEVKNPALPGKRLRYMSRIIQNSKQLEPYENLFGFNRSKEYEGTMFRLPFRAHSSELSGTCYSESSTMQLLEDIHKHSDNLILFLQHVRTITCQRINDGENSPTTLFKIHRKEIPLSLSQTLECTSALSVESVKGDKSESNDWLVSNCTELNGDHEAVSSVACLLDVEVKEGGVFYNVKTSLKGEVFCYLPLSLFSGLPVHVSCNFAVNNNRRDIWKSGDPSSSDSDEDVSWNKFLMENVIPTAYFQLLKSLKCMHENGILSYYEFHSLWPLESKLYQRDPWPLFVKALYRELESSSLFYSDMQSKWLTMRASKFLVPNILNKSATPCILEVLKHLNLPLVDLPMKFRPSFDLGDTLLDEKQFIHLFFSQLPSLSNLCSSRNKVIQYMLEALASGCDNRSEISKVLQNYLTNHACIPCSPNGYELKKCCELIHRSAKFSKLYEADEGMFPHEDLIARDLAGLAMKRVGIISENIPWSYIVERAHTITELRNSDELRANERVQLLIESMTSYARGNPPSDIHTIKFLPVMKRPEEYPLNLKWFAEGQQLSCGDMLMLSGPRDESARLAGTQVAFVCQATPKDGGCGQISAKAQNILHLKRSPVISQVIKHFEMMIINSFKNIPPQWIHVSCKIIYGFFHSALENKDITEDALASLKEQPCIWIDDTFVYSDMVSFNWSRDGPYLYKVPPNLSEMKSLCSALDIKERFSFQDIQKALEKMKNDYGDEAVDESCKAVLSELISLFSHHSEKNHIDKKCHILIPDENLVLRCSTDLAYNDAHWLQRDDTYTYVHEMIPRKLAEDLGVKPVRSKLLDKHSSKYGFRRGHEFGQRENLTRRIRNIIRDYPYDITILKELLQNADDAKAKKMYVILDKRFHRSNSVLSEKWQDLQGPALLIWNDSVFSEKDLEGIQELGLGSKRSEAESIGQYGIGFNVVYHLTDCPSFITDDATLCIMDPHCRYVPGADVLSPGRRFDLSQDFWKDFPDLKSAYLHDGLSDVSSEISGGSLFRFPIRHSEKIARASEVIESSEGSVGSLDTEKLYSDLTKWMPKMKDAMFFLNNVTEIKFFVIEKDSDVMKAMFHFRTQIPESASADRIKLRDMLSAFKTEAKSKTGVITYPLTLTEYKSGGGVRNKIEQKWLIQQGVGDIDNPDRVWKYVQTVKPRHGMAALMSRSRRSQKDQKVNGQVFCFLPLPISSNLPVHVNGHFILNSTRRELWKSTDPNTQDERSLWNDNIIRAIASSYTHFFLQAQQHFLNPEYKDIHTLLSQIERYFGLFPRFSGAKSQGDRWQDLARDVYKLILEHNVKILCVVGSTDTSAENQNPKYQAEWYPPKSVTSASHVYFYPHSSFHRDDIYPVLKAIGMKMTPAPIEVMECFNLIISQLKLPQPATRFCSVSPHSVFDYFTQKSTFSSGVTKQPIAISDSSFRTIESFLAFTKYLLSSEETQDQPSLFGLSPRSPRSRAHRTKYVFPHTPFGHYLLVTADGIMRKFDEKNKIIVSPYLTLFPNSLDCFLHQNLLVANYSNSYFIQPSDRDSDRIIQFIRKIFDDNLPQGLKSVAEVSNATEVLPREKMYQYWDCFSNDRLLKCYIERVLENWALLFTIDNRAFSARSNILPVVHSLKRIGEVLKKLRMPFLDTSVVKVTLSCCPSVSDHHERILSNIYHINQANSINLVLSKEEIDVIIGYLANNIKLNPEALKHLKSLPLFMNIDGSYTSILNKAAFIWPSEACSEAYQKWLEGHDAVFIKANTKWSSLGSSEQFLITTISAEKLYIQFIFPHFHKMNPKERYVHLQFIRDRFYNNIEYLSKITDKKGLHSDFCCKISEACEFKSAMKTLPCIGESNLHPVSTFCDHTVKIFQTFPSHFMFLPDEYRDECREEKEWLSFFRKLGLIQCVTKEEFIQFCQKTADGKVKDIRACSTVLLDHMFSYKVRKDWENDRHFLNRVSEIAFVLPEHVPELNSVVPCVCPVNQAIKLKGSASSSLASLLWTVKPLIDLPKSCSTGSSSMTNSLDITINPSTSEVIANIQNICEKSQYADQSLFENYPEHMICSHGHNRCNMLDIMCENLRYLQAEKGFISSIAKVQSLPCIPVSAEKASVRKASNTVTSQKIEMKVVLVKPCCVVIAEDVSDYHPYLHKLPTKLQGLRILERIGVKEKLGMSHMQIVLEAIYSASEGAELNPNTSECVAESLKLLNKFLKLKQETNILEYECYLTPLYLPDIDDIMRPSKSLLYADSSSYLGVFELNLITVEHYFHFNLSKEDYKFDTHHFCKLLPKSVRPVGLSEACTQRKQKECKHVKESKIASQLMKVLQMKEIPEAIIRVIIRQSIAEQENEDDLKERITLFLTGIKILTAENLCSEIILKEGSVCIGTQETDYFFEPGESESCLYLDDQLKPSSDQIDDACAEIASYLYYNVVSKVIHKEKAVQGLSTSYEEKQVIKCIELCLKATEWSELQGQLKKKYGIDFNGGGGMRSFKKKLGEKIPQCWHHRLDQDIDNVFNSMDYVGYEDEENDIILAQIVHRIDLKPGEHRLAQRYKIYTSGHDRDGKDVNILTLYKFLVGLKKRKVEPKPAGNDDLALVEFNEDDDVPKLRATLIHDNLVDIKRKICEQLKEIWKLDEELRKKAIRRMFLRWHPDKNPDKTEVAEEIFKFMLKQIEHLEKGEPMDDPKTSEGQSFSSPTYHRRNYRRRSYYYSGWSRNSGWGRNFYRWDNTANQHHSSWEYEDEYFSCGGGSASFSSHSHTNRSDFFPFDEKKDEKKPEEGRRWVKQAEVEYGVLCVVHDKVSACCGYSYVCFMAHQVVEKALKGAVYALCGMDGRDVTDNNLSKHAHAVQTTKPEQAEGLVFHCLPLESYYLDTRYPNRWEGYTDAPSDHYTLEQANKAKEHAKAVLDIVKTVMPKQQLF